MKERRFLQYRWRWIAIVFFLVVVTSSVYLLYGKAYNYRTCVQPVTVPSSRWTKGYYVTLDRTHPYCKETFTLKSSLPYQNKDLCCNHGRNKTLPELCGTVNDSALGSKETQNPTCKCVDFMACRMVTVTAVSSDHYAELLEGLASLQNFHPDMKIFVYSIGLSNCQISNLNSLYNVKVHLFPFEKYPPHVRKLQNYAWKMLIVPTVIQEYEIVFYMDSSTRLRRSLTVSLLPDLQNFPFRGEMSVYHNGEFTVDSMYTWFGCTRKEFGSNVQVKSGVQLFRKTPTTAKLLQDTASCALHSDCIDPPGVSSIQCHGSLHYTDPATLTKVVPKKGCFKYDQSALTVLLHKYFSVHSQSSFIQPLEHTLAVMGSSIHCFSLYKRS